ncbi:MAG: lysozyme inhibitor LprI family protein, partial [Flavobacteriales bacterium]
QKRMADLSNDRKTKLRDVQRKWIAYRDANCQFYADPDGGSLARVEANACMLRMTAARAEELAQAVSP